MLRRHPREQVDVWARKLLDEESRHPTADPALSPLLPGADESRYRTFVRESRARRREGYSAAGALPAALDRPSYRRAAARTERRDDAGQ